MNVASAPPMPLWRRVGRTARSAMALLIYFGYLVIMGLIQRIVLYSQLWLMPSRRNRTLGAWGRFHANMSCAVARIGGVRIRVIGAIPPEAGLVLMNHQSVLDIPIALSVSPITSVIPVRQRYRKWMPTVSPFLRASDFPKIEQTRKSLAADLAAIRSAADRVQQGELRIILFPEGHRSRTGEILPFMKGGLQVILQRARRPVYCIVGDGMWRARTFADAMVNLAGVQVTARIIGPFMPPEKEGDIPRFIESLRQQMIDTLREMRSASSQSTDAAAG